MTDSTERFRERSEMYALYRPAYPRNILQFLQAACTLTRQSRVADIGCGTGLLAERFLQHGNPVWGIEPNPEMRREGEKRLAGYPLFTSLPGTAEKIPLPSDSMDFVTAGQAFHWFELETTREEFSRILRVHGWSVLVWQLPKTQTVFENEYEKVLRDFGRDYQKVREKQADQLRIRQLFGSQPFVTHHTETRQSLDLEGLRGRVLSCSFMPLPENPSYEAMQRRLERIFSAHQVDGRVVLHYDTHLFAGRLSS